VPKKSLFWKPQNLQQQNEEELPVNIKNNNVIRMTIRLLQANDIQTVTDMCCQEYGVGNVALNLPKTLTAAIEDADFKALNRLAQDLFDEFVLRVHVDWTMRLKVQVPPPISDITSSPNNNGNTLMAQQQQQPPPPDHAVLLLTLSDATYNNHQDEEESQEAVVGIVEVSQQPPIPERNPPAFPIPLVVKQMYCWWWSVLQQQKQQQKRRQSFTSKSNNKALMTRRMNNMIIKPEGWITNVLVAPEFRGQGWAKVLVHACEGVARSWNVPAIHLHCDANSVSGRVAQQLYTSMGYQDSCIVNNNTEYESSPASSSSSEYDWMKLAAQAEAAAGLWSSSSSSSTTDTVYPTTEPVMCSSSVYVIEGVPLLYLKKDLV
jgi:ribosomal protein S18 acetylase RimI-like enzyme